MSIASNVHHQELNIVAIRQQFDLSSVLPDLAVATSHVTGTGTGTGPGTAADGAETNHDDHS